MIGKVLAALRRGLSAFLISMGQIAGPIGSPSAVGGVIDPAAGSVARDSRRETAAVRAEVVREQASRATSGHGQESNHVRGLLDDLERRARRVHQRGQIRPGDGWSTVRRRRFAGDLPGHGQVVPSTAFLAQLFKSVPLARREWEARREERGRTVLPGTTSVRRVVIRQPFHSGSRQSSTRFAGSSSVLNQNSPWSSEDIQK